MTSDLKIAANRRNATRSTGPKTVPGKARSRGNAVRHGLSSRPDGAVSRQVEEIADRITEVTAGPRDIVLAAAKARLDVTRVQQARVETIDRYVQKEMGKADQQLDDKARISLAIAESASKLAPFDRYERYALTREKKAMHALEYYQRAKSAPAKTTTPQSPNSRGSSTTQSKESAAIVAQKLAEKKTRVLSATINYNARLTSCLAASIRNRRKNFDKRFAKIFAMLAGIVHQYLRLNMLDAAIDKIDLALQAAPHHLLLHALHVCVLLITGGDQEARKIIIRYRGRFDNGKEWEDIVVDQLRLLRKAPLMKDKVLLEVERILEPPEPLSVMIIKRPHIQKNIEAAFQLMLAREFGRALETVELALPELPRSVDLNVMRAHALMFLDRTEEARAFYQEFRDLRNFMSLSGIEIAVSHFKMMLEAGLIHRLMAEIIRLR